MLPSSPRTPSPPSCSLALLSVRLQSAMVPRSLRYSLTLQLKQVKKLSQPQFRSLKIKSRRRRTRKKSKTISRRMLQSQVTLRSLATPRRSQRVTRRPSTRRRPQRPLLKPRNSRLRGRLRIKSCRRRPQRSKRSRRSSRKSRVSSTSRFSRTRCRSVETLLGLQLRDVLSRKLSLCICQSKRKSLRLGKTRTVKSRMSRNRWCSSKLR